jgi:hypothetical protein
MNLTPRQVRAISHYLEGHPELRLSVQCRGDQVYFSEKQTGETVTVPMADLLDTYDEDRKETARERARGRRVEKTQ